MLQCPLLLYVSLTQTVMHKDENTCERMHAIVNLVSLLFPEAPGYLHAAGTFLQIVDLSF